MSAVAPSTGFVDRLELARKMIYEANGETPSVGLADQWWAAERQAQGDFDAFTAVLAEANWKAPRRGRPATVDAQARIMAAVNGCRACVHLRRGGPQPCWARLAVRRLDCGRCVATLVLPPADESDRCDWCGATGVVRFTPRAIQMGPVIIIGDACSDCARALRLDGDAA